jgi:hypothetical protein
MQIVSYTMTIAGFDGGISVINYVVNLKRFFFLGLHSQTVYMLFTADTISAHSKFVNSLQLQSCFAVLFRSCFLPALSCLFEALFSE